MSEQTDQWACVTEYKPYKKEDQGSSNRRLKSLGSKKVRNNVLALAFIAMLVILIILVSIFLWKGSWIIPFLQ